MIVKLLTEHHLAFLSLKGGCTGSSESTLVKMSNCWKSRAGAHLSLSWSSLGGLLNIEMITVFFFSKHMCLPNE